MRNPSERTRPHRRLAAGLIVLLMGLPLISVPAHAEPSRAELDRAINELGHLEEDLSAVVEQRNQLKVEIEATQKELDSAKKDFDQWNSEANAAQADLDARTADVYKSGLESRLNAFFGSGSFSDFSDRVTYLSSISDENQRVAANASVLRQKADWARQAAERAQAELQAKEADLQDKESQIQATIGRQEALVSRLEISYEKAMDQWRAEQAAAAAAAQEATNEGGGGSSDSGETFNPPPASSGASLAVATAMAQQGDEYQWAAAGPDEFDCSGLTMYAWAKAGVSLPHSSASQYASLPHVDKDQLQPGDLVFFYNPIHHVGMYIGGGNMVHAFSEGSPVSVDSVFGGYYGDVYTGAARPG